MRIQVTAGVVAALVLAACDSGGSAVQTRERAAAEPVALISAAAPESETVAAAPEAKPPVTANRRETADAKVQRLYERNGAAFGAKSADDYLQKVRTFIEATPRGTETVKRPNGDTLYYQASTNTFAVVDRNGVPRTMFKPDDGPSYWAQQKERAPTFGQRRTSSRSAE
ncbi:S-type pyocin family protein [Brevundimonas sp.]|uniref:S-type pyocin family protein n=1 Tax=Brevundimonas sp. TaxID=1871086 RepID=UPI0028A6B958|nr:S-type pyocin family protein [Brevundimonas sp.]